MMKGHQRLHQSMRAPRREITLYNIKNHSLTSKLIVPVVIMPFQNYLMAKDIREAI
jgi:hypothetical protein